MSLQGFPNIQQLHKDTKLFDNFSRFDLQPENAYKLYTVQHNGDISEAGISQNNRLRLAPKGKKSWVGVVANGLGISRQVIFSEVTDTRSIIEMNMHLEFQSNENLEAFVGLHAGGKSIQNIPNEKQRYCGVVVDTSNNPNLLLSSSDTEKEKITDTGEFVPYHYRLHILWESNEKVKLSLFRGTPQDDFKKLIAEHESDGFAKERIDSFFMHWFIKTKSNDEKGLITKGWWLEAR